MKLMCLYAALPTYEANGNVSVGHWRQSLLPLTSIFIPPPPRTLHFFLWEMGHL